MEHIRSCAFCEGRLATTKRPFNPHDYVSEFKRNGEQMELSEVVAARRKHLNRLSNQGGADGESVAIETMGWLPRPTGRGMRRLLNELKKTGISIKWSSFDAIAMSQPIDFTDPAVIQHHLPEMVFIEIKTANQDRVRPDFGGFFFALTENEISADEQLGDRYRVALFNRRTEEILLTTVADIAARARSTTWQVSVQL